MNAAPSRAVKRMGRGLVARHGDRPARAIEHPSFTVLAGSGSPRAGFEWEHESGRRSRVTAREAALLQSFPSAYRWQGAESRLYQQIGNAVPPLLAEAILRSVTRKATA